MFGCLKFRWNFWIFFLLLTLTLLSGCSHPENYRWSGTPNFYRDPNLDKSLNDIKGYTFDWNQPSVTVYAFSTPTKDASPLTVKDLSDHGQLAYIQAMTQSNTNLDQIRGNLAKPVVSPSKITMTSKKVQNRFDRTLVANVTKGLAASPGDRLMWTWILVKPDNFTFDGYTVLATDNQILNIEHVENQTTTSIQGQASATFPSPANPSVGITASLNNQYTTSADINQQYVKNGVDIFDKFLRIYRESERNLDVSGNTLISLSAVAPTDNRATVLLASNPILSKNGKKLTPNDAEMEITLVKRPSHCPLTAQVQLVYQLRKITCHEDSYVEGEQKVSIEQRVTGWKKVDIVSADEVQPIVYGIYATGDVPVHAETLNNEKALLVFDDYETARNVANWMTTRQAHSIGSISSKIDFNLGYKPIPKSFTKFTAKVADPVNCL